MNAPTRFIQVTNDNPLVKYEYPDSWVGIARTDASFQIGNMGSPVSSFLQESVGPNKTIIFTFEGLGVMVMTSALGPAYANNFVSCKIDDELLTMNTIPSPQNNWPICNSGNLPDGEHTLTITFIGSGLIFFDYILYAPSPTPIKTLNLTDVSVRMDASDPCVTYSGAFTLQNDTGPTRFVAEGESITVLFVGQQLTWYRAYLAQPGILSTLAGYSVDGGTPIQFLLDNPLNSNFSSLNEPFFQTEILPQGPHHIKAIYVDYGGVALCLSFVVVQNVSHTTSSSLLDGTTTPTVDVTATPFKIPSARSTHNDMDLIIGTVIGVGVFFFS